MDIQKIKDILSKLGIFRAGTATWKGDAKNRPIDFMKGDTPKKNTPKDKKSIIFTGIILLNVLLILVLTLGVRFNLGTLIAIVIVFVFRKMYLTGKFSSVFSLLGAGVALALITLVSISIFAKPEVTEDTESNSAGNIDEMYVIFNKISEVTQVSEEIEDKILIKAGTEGTLYYKGKGIGAKKINSDLVRKISPTMREMGFDVTSAGEVGGNQQLGGESYQKDNIFCDAISGVYAKNFTNPTSSFTFKCAYIKDRGNSYTEANEIELDY